MNPQSRTDRSEKRHGPENSEKKPEYVLWNLYKAPLSIFSSSWKFSYAMVSSAFQTRSLDALSLYVGKAGAKWGPGQNAIFQFFLDGLSCPIDT